MINDKFAIFLEEFCTNILTNSTDIQQTSNMINKLKKHFKITLSGF